MDFADTAPALASHLPYPLACRILHFTPHSRMQRHSSPWAELNFALSGIMEISIEGVSYLSPPQYAIWIPPGVEHCCQNEGEVHYACIDIPAEACAGLPDAPCTLEISPVIRAILGDYERRGIRYPATPQDRRMAQVVIDQLRGARAYASYLPSTTEPVLAPILSALQRHPGDKRGAAHWAATAGITERTLLRHCQQHLGMSFNDWRQRLRVVSALGMLEAGHSVQTVAREMGYSTASAFIAMFQRLTGESPDSARKRGPAALA
ncbi:AraC family transcriptional regulator [Achromobacter piechaudii]|uniref:HTH-type transcriptional regulator NimR n=1 Tax=Achromobacter piechaudii TaxID=72556 RepID=A0A6S7E8L0_9BURK|nr:helix-turn-helix transcriptional regulator [Achromobacter piechaudii]CAB3710157.1 HTH-type transcriptional regulator NimR [Achromobacter piechaudii]CAB3875880.1 HTH-type transcriptional regulator NimR [Achromobacter piechaudii]CAB3901159.1 HTH-type transcriptional regulator NimR [Achromobacter piechaudii]CAB3953591.1 HTH-type transcriptional regulator NimR [Achromobacter piechaudii]